MRYSHRARIFPGSSDWPWNNATRLRRCLRNRTKRVVSGTLRKRRKNLRRREAVGRAAARRWRGSKSYPYLRGRSIVAPRNLNGTRDYRPREREGEERERETEGGLASLRANKRNCTRIYLHPPARAAYTVMASSRQAPLRWLWFNRRGGVKLLSV